MDLEEAINECSNVVQSMYAVEAAIEYTFVDEARSIHAAITLVEEAQYGLSEQFSKELYRSDENEQQA